jgi:hypothetical protein
VEGFNMATTEAQRKIRATSHRMDSTLNKSRAGLLVQELNRLQALAYWVIESVEGEEMAVRAEAEQALWDFLGAFDTHVINFIDQDDMREA